MCSCSDLGLRAGVALLPAGLAALLRRQLVHLGSVVFGHFLLRWTNVLDGGLVLVHLGYAHRLASSTALTAATSLAARVFWAFAADRLAFIAAALFLLPAFPFFLAISVYLPMMIPLDGVRPKCGVFRPASCVAGPVDAGFGEGTLVSWIFALPIALVIVLLLVHAFAGGEVAWFLDQLVIAGVLAFGIVKTFFA